MPQFRITWVNVLVSDFIRSVEYRKVVFDVEPRNSLLAVNRKFLCAWVKSAKRLENDMIKLTFVCLGNEPELPKKFRSLTVKSNSMLTEEKLG